MTIDACGATHTGNLRRHNEDNIYVEGNYRLDLTMNNVIFRGKRGERPYTYAVFDGLGGEAKGEYASRIAAMGLRAMDDRGAAGDIDAYISAVHRSVLDDAEARDARNMGTTAAVLHIDGNKAIAYNVGDSRTYLLRGEMLRQLSKDHSVIQSMIDNGLAAAAEKNREKYAGELTRYLGMPAEEDPDPEAYVCTETIRPGDKLLLCSDGLTAELTDEDIFGIMTEYSSASTERLAAVLIKEAVDRKGRDNISAIVCSVE